MPRRPTPKRNAAFIPMARSQGLSVAVVGKVVGLMSSSLAMRCRSWTSAMIPLSISRQDKGFFFSCMRSIFSLKNTQALHLFSTRSIAGTCQDVKRAQTCICPQANNRVLRNRVSLLIQEQETESFSRHDLLSFDGQANGVLIEGSRVRTTPVHLQARPLATLLREDHSHTIRRIVRIMVLHTKEKSHDQTTTVSFRGDLRADAVN